MVRDWFILRQRDCGLRRHLDSVPLDTPIREIVDRCMVRESHSDMNRLSPAPPLVPVAVMQDVADDSSSGWREGAWAYRIGPQNIGILPSYSQS